MDVCVKPISLDTFYTHYDNLFITNLIIVLPRPQDLEAWYRLLQRSKCLPNSIHEVELSAKTDKRTGCVIS